MDVEQLVHYANMRMMTNLDDLQTLKNKHQEKDKLILKLGQEIEALQQRLEYQIVQTYTEIHKRDETIERRAETGNALADEVRRLEMELSEWETGKKRKVDPNPESTWKFLAEGAKVQNDVLRKQIADLFANKDILDKALIKKNQDLTYVLMQLEDSNKKAQRLELECVQLNAKLIERGKELVHRIDYINKIHEALVKDDIPTTTTS